MLHQIKIQKAFADAVLNGDKQFEVRYNDRGYQKGDIVKFVVMDGSLTERAHKLNRKPYEITYVLSSFVGLASGYVVFGIREADCNDCRFVMQNCHDMMICCERKTEPCEYFEPME